MNEVSADKNLLKHLKSFLGSSITCKEVSLSLYVCYNAVMFVCIKGSCKLLMCFLLGVLPQNEQEKRSHITSCYT